MKDQFEFPVVGTFYRDAESQAKARSLKEGVPLELRRMPSEQFPNAVGVFADDVQIGWVPDKGLTCTNCWSPVKSSEKCCKNCGVDYLVVGGLATRIVGRGLKDGDYLCYVAQVNKNDPVDVVRATFMFT